MHSLRADYAGFPEYAGQYRLESVLGSGGMGVVHLATSGSGLKLAVKIVHAEHAVDPEFRARFRQEVAAARRVSGAFTAPVVDADPDAERPWMATLFIDAPTLSERVREKVLDPAELARLAAGLAEALRDIHRAGVVHRDLKPSNVLMAPDGVRVIDFGISRPADSDLRTETGKLIGTPPFMAPEQFQRPREVGTAADVFALGAVLVYAATGHGPFDSDSHYLVAYQVVHSEPDLTGLPSRLVPLVARCLAKDPAERPTAEALIAEMRALAYPTAEDTQAFIPRPRRPVEAEQVTHQRERVAAAPQAPPRRRTRMAVGAGVGLLLLVGGTAAGYQQFGTAPGPPAQIAAKTGTAPQKSFAPWAVPLGKPATGSRTGACSWQAALYCAGPGLVAARLDPADGSTVWALEAPGPAQGATVLSAPQHAGGQVLAVVPGSETLQALDPDTGAERWRHKLPGGSQAVVAGGQILLVGTGGSVTALDPAHGTPRWTRQIGGVGSVWWGDGGPKGGTPALYVATPESGGGSTQIAAVDPADGTVRRQLRTEGRLRPVGTARGGLYLLELDASSRTTAVVHADLTTRTVHRVRPKAPLFDAEATVDPDGNTYLFGTSGTLVAVGADKELWRSETGVTVASRPVFTDGRVCLMAPDGRLLAVDAASGRPAGQTRPRMTDGKATTYAATLPAPVAGDGRVFGSAPDGTVFAVAADPGGW
ncbi:MULTISPECIES: serine/threonine-protein kinase [Streptomyces]|uniref:Serine/threonine protein kinase n=1 Tax=Streptomyces spororaveus TaxID=284039 RepID=A0ABQ3TDT3_9ACTN|nr:MULTISPECIES: serine/threonine-protein kinase [Streptomyces]MCM9081029.1 serine/threonine-protein kinase [Streptomyces spororaveus]MCX5304524.1 serine/threonine-protein kinase [Streptomyces sp. NBC_00160]GHI78580.1 serine/threonine protein kinase [Streptomyces spororaveus]